MPHPPSDTSLPSPQNLLGALNQGLVVEFWILFSFPQQAETQLPCVHPDHPPDPSLVFWELEEDFFRDAPLCHAVTSWERLAQATCASVEILVVALLEDLAPSATPDHLCSALSCHHSRCHQALRLLWENPREHLLVDTALPSESLVMMPLSVVPHCT